MRILYLECNAGISGDMFTAALLDLGLDIKFLQKELAKLNLKDQFKIQTRNIKKNSITCKQFQVKEKKEQERSLADIKTIIQKSRLDKDIKNRAVKMFERLHKAEEKIHRESHHFHELGLLDTIVDVVSAIVGLKYLQIRKVYASRVNIGSGFVKTHHGLLPVPAPATAELLKGIPVFSTGPETELVTPTGALILSEFVDQYIMPVFKISRIGYGAGTKKFDDFPNFLRVFSGETDQADLPEKVLIETNIDDLNPQIYEYIMEKLFARGALDVYLTPVYMKKNRPGIILSCICEKKDEEKIIETIFRETSTIGLRIHYPKRVELAREKKKVMTEYGEAEVKVSYYHGQKMNVTPEYESCKKLAQKKGIPLKDVFSAVRRKTLY